MRFVLSLLSLLSLTIPSTSASTCSYQQYNLSKLTTNSDLVANVTNPYTTKGQDANYYIYLNPCSVVNQRDGEAVHATVYGRLVTNDGTKQQLNSDVLASDLTTSVWEYKDVDNPLDGVIQTYTTTDKSCAWTGKPTLATTKIIYQCALSTPEDYLNVKTSIVNDVCITEIIVPTRDACIDVKPKIACQPAVNGRTWDLSPLTGIDRYSLPTTSGSLFSYYMNVCNNITHTGISKNDKQAMIIQYYDGLDSYHATLASIDETKTPVTFSWMDSNNATAGLRATYISNDLSCQPRTTTVDFVCEPDDPSLPLWYVDRTRRSFAVDDSKACTVHMTYHAHNACPLPPPPTTLPPTTLPPTTEAPTTPAPTTEAPTTAAPTTEAPTTAAPTTEAPTTEAPTTAAPTTKSPVTTAPPTNAPRNATGDASPSSSSNTTLAIGLGGGLGAGVLLSILLFCLYRRCQQKNAHQNKRSINQMHARDPLLEP